MQYYKYWYEVLTTRNINFIIYNDGVIAINERNYTSRNGKKLYEILTSEIYDKL